MPKKHVATFVAVFTCVYVCDECVYVCVCMSLPVCMYVMMMIKIVLCLVNKRARSACVRACYYSKMCCVLLIKEQELLSW